MLRARTLLYRFRSWLHRRDVSVWYDPRYRLPLSGLEVGAGIEPRRADFVMWWLRESGAVPAEAVHAPRRITYDDLARVHTPELLESLGRPEAIAHIFAVDAVRRAGGRGHDHDPARLRRHPRRRARHAPDEARPRSTSWAGSTMRRLERPAGSAR